MNRYIKINWDAACDNNSKLKLMGLGVAVFVDSVYREELSKAEFYGTNGTNNIGEWAGLELASKIAVDLENLDEFKHDTLFIRLYGDSQLVVKQYSGEYKIKQDHLRPYRQKVLSKLEQLKSEYSVHWIPRTENKEADKLSKVALTYFNK